MLRFVHSLSLRFVLVIPLACALVDCGQDVAGEEVDFSREIRAVLSDKCFLCHGPDEANRQGGLRLDDRAAAIESGAIVPGDADASEILKRIFSDDPDTVMPPPTSGKTVTEAEAKRLRDWIDQGATYEGHWAFTPPQRPALPPVSDATWCRTPVDFFVLERLDREVIKPSPAADRGTLIRRLYLDLVGLPPSPSDLDRWLANPSQDWTAELIDELMNSAHFGERWARWWLDAARYSDSDGYEKDKPRSVWFYRDWVIDALNRDKPYDEFIVEQIAGDLLEGATQSERVATGFLRNSMVNEEGGADPEQFRVEGMFDRMDAIGKAILGITTQCAQCHTHKYDPLTHDEYYQMFAALNDFHEAIVTVYSPEEATKRDALVAEMRDLEQHFRAEHPDWMERLASWQQSAKAKRAEWTTVLPYEVPFEGQKFRQLEDGSIVSESYAPTKNDISFPCVVQPGRITAVRIELLTHPQFPHGGPGRSIYGTGALTEFDVSAAPQGEPHKKTLLKFSKALADVNPSTSTLPLVYRERDPDKDDRTTGGIEFAIDGNGKTAWSTDNGPGRRNQDRHAFFVLAEPLEVKEPTVLWFHMIQNHGGWNSDDNQNYLLGRYRFSVTANEDPANAFLPMGVEKMVDQAWKDLSPEDQSRLFAHWITTIDEGQTLAGAIESLWQQHPEGTSQLAVERMEQPRQTFVMLRGDFLKPGDAVQPGVPAFLNRLPESDEPARLRFARWMVSDDSPTTARVIVNRIWQAYFGRGIVSTPEDFGFQSPPPSHPELLDWLAVELVESGWSLKHVHRLIANSATYQQASLIDSPALERDRYNELLARGPRFRVDAEIVRDVALATSGLLDSRVGGPSVYPPAPAFLFQPPASYGPKIWATDTNSNQYRRSLYVHGYRSVAYPPLQIFDAPKGDAACIRRERSNTPLQALVLLNETQFHECARGLAARIVRESPESDDRARIRFAHRLVTGREPDAVELDLLLGVLTQQRIRVTSGQVNAEQLVGASETVSRQLVGESASEIAPWIVVARVLLNLDETMTKG